MRTEGDVRQDVSLESFGGQGVFVKDIEALLLSGDIDMAVHSLKDMPASLPDSLTIGAVLERGDPRDALVTRGGVGLEDLPKGARVGTDSRRRSVQLLAMRPDLRVESVRGNVDTRIGKVDSGEYAAVVLAAAGLERLGLIARSTRIFSTNEMVPAVGQAVLAVECRSADTRALTILHQIDHERTRSEITAERAYLQRLGAGCRLPVGAFAVTQGQTLTLEALLATENGRLFRESQSGSVEAAEALGRELAEVLMDRAGVEAAS